MIYRTIGPDISTYFSLNDISSFKSCIFFKNYVLELPNLEKF